MDIPEIKTKIVAPANSSATAHGSFFDVSERALIGLEGADAQDLLQRLSTNDVSRLMVGGTLQTVLTNEKGRMLEVLSVVKPEENKLLLVGQSSDAEGLAQWFDKLIIMEDAKVELLSSVYAQYVLYDSASLQDISRSMTVPEGTYIWEENWGGARILHLLSNESDRARLIDELTRVGAHAAEPDQFENFRVSHGMPKSPNELSDRYNPLEANLSSLISWTKGCYIGQEVIARLDTYKKVQKRLVRLILDEFPDTLPLSLWSEEGEVGTLTSAIKPRTGQKTQGLGYVRIAQLERSENLFFNSGNLRILARPVIVESDKAETKTNA
jgi:folate-binding protein YgfZ